MNQCAEVSRSSSGIRPMKAVMHLAIAAMALAALPAFATLGGNSASVAADQKAFQATLKTSTQAGYTDYSLTLTNGIIVHEFVNSANQVFEVTWNGKGMRPDMKQLLGSYFSHFGTSEKEVKPAERQPTRREAMRVGTNFVAHSAVHNRIFSGTAHLPSMVPASLSGPISVPNDSLPVGSAH